MLNDAHDSFHLVLWWGDWWVIVKVMMLEASFFFLKSCSNASGQWWLSNIGSSRGADEEFSLSSLTQGYGSILLSTLFLFHHKLLPLSVLHLSLIANFACCHLSRLVGDNDSVFHCLNFSLPLLSSSILRCLSFISPMLVWSDIDLRVLTIIFVTLCFLTFSQSSPSRNTVGEAASVDFPATGWQGKSHVFTVICRKQAAPD